MIEMRATGHGMPVDRAIARKIPLLAYKRGWLALDVETVNTFGDLTMDSQYKSKKQLELCHDYVFVSDRYSLEQFLQAFGKDPGMNNGKNRFYEAVIQDGLILPVFGLGRRIEFEAIHPDIIKIVQNQRATSEEKVFNHRITVEPQDLQLHFLSVEKDYFVFHGYGSLQEVLHLRMTPEFLIDLFTYGMERKHSINLIARKHEAQKLN